MNDIMTSNRARTDIVFVIYSGVTLLDVTGPLQVFAEANVLDGERDPLFSITLASYEGGPVPTDAGVALDTIPLARVAVSPDLLVVSGGLGVFDAMSRPAPVRALGELAESADTVASTCMGTFLLAATGLLSGRKVTTHWRWTGRLQTEFPDLKVQNDEMTVHDGKFWTAGGVTAGIDLALELLGRSAGDEARRAVAGRLVMVARRAGGQRQYAPPDARARRRCGSRFQSLHAWMERSIAANLSVEALAAKARMSPRHFSRVYADEEGITPARAVETMRVRHARRMLESSDAPMKAVAADCGFVTQDRMRKAFLRSVGATPSEYRARFGAVGQDDG